MTTATDAPPIHHALAAVMAEVQAVGKDSVNRDQGFNFRGIDAVVNAVGPVLRKHGVIVTPHVEAIEYDAAPTRSGGRINTCRVRVRYTFTGPAGDSLSCLVAGEAFDSGDKSTAKAMSVAFRVALLQALALPTHEPDPDLDTYDAQPGRHNGGAVIGRGDAPTADPDARLAALRDAMGKAQSVEDLRTIYTEHGVGGAPAEVKAEFQAAVDAMKAAEANAGDHDPDADAAEQAAQEAAEAGSV